MNIRNSLAVFLLFWLMLAPCLSILYLQHQRQKTRKTVKALLLKETPEEQLVHFHFRFNELQLLDWEKDHEFQYEGEMYDVVQADTLQDGIHYTCWWDHEESQLVRKLKKLLNKALQTDPENDDDEKLLSLFKYAGNLNRGQASGPSSGKRVYPDREMALRPDFSLSPSPPPKQA